jgi:hypothetical protein
MSTDPGRTAEHEDAPAVDRLLALTDGVVAIALTLEIGRRKGLTTRETDPRAVRAGLLRSLGTSVVILASIGLAWVNTDAAKYCWLLIALVPYVVDRWLLRPAGPDSAPSSDAGRAPPGA